MSRLLENLLIFGRVLRRAGIDVHPGRLLDVIEALGYVDLGSRDSLRGRRVALNGASGTAVKIDRQGRLEIDFDGGGRRTIESGEVTYEH